MLSRHWLVPAMFVYPGKAKNSIDTLTKDGSTVTASEGGVDGTTTAWTCESHRRAAMMTEDRQAIVGRHCLMMWLAVVASPELYRGNHGFIGLLGASPDWYSRSVKCHEGHDGRGSDGQVT